MERISSVCASRAQVFLVYLFELMYQSFQLMYQSFQVWRKNPWIVTLTTYFLYVHRSCNIIQFVFPSLVIEMEMTTMETVSGFSTELLILSTVVLYFLYRSNSKSLRYNLPPSASILNNVPIFGYIPFLNLQTFHEEVAKLGPIVRYKLGPDDVVM